jgi:hypothetical protein
MQEMPEIPPPRRVYPVFCAISRKVAELHHTYNTAVRAPYIITIATNPGDVLSRTVSHVTFSDALTECLKFAFSQHAPENADEYELQLISHHRDLMHHIALLHKSDGTASEQRPSQELTVTGDRTLFAPPRSCSTGTVRPSMKR